MKHSFRMFLSLGVIVILTAYGFTYLHQPAVWKVFPLVLLPMSWHHFPYILELLQALIIALATYLIVRWDLMRPVLHVTEWMKDLRLGKEESPPPPTQNLLEPLAKEVTHMAKSLTEARAA